MIDFLSFFIIEYPLGFEDYAIFIYAVLALPIPYLSYGFYKFCNTTIKNKDLKLWAIFLGRLVLTILLVFLLINLLSTVVRISLLVFGIFNATLFEMIISVILIIVIIGYMIIFPWKYLWRKD